MRNGMILGLTGPTGAGKGRVCRVLEQEGFGIVDTDLLAREAVQPHTACLAALTEAFTAAILHEDGTLNRRELARRAFATPEDTARLNSITHPAILALCERDTEAHFASGKCGVVLDAPLLFESGLDERCDRILAVTAPSHVRLQRLIQRDNLTEEELRRRMAAQPSDAFYAERADAVVVNDGTLDALEQQVRQIVAVWKEEIR